MQERQKKLELAENASPKSGRLTFSKSPSQMLDLRMEKFNRKGTERLLVKNNTLKGREQANDYKSFRTMRKDMTLPPMPRMSRVSEHIEEELASNEDFKAQNDQFETGGTK